MVENRQALVSNIVYLASLVSDVRHIEHWLDSLRMVTSQHNAASPLSPKDEHTLLNLQSQLKGYLVNGDPLRRFEPEILDQKMYENLQGHQRYSRLRKVVGIIIGLSIGMGIGTALLTRIVGGMSSVPQMPFLAAFVTFCLGAVFLLAQAARTFNRHLRQVYVMLCCVIVFTAILVGQFSLFAILKDSWWIKAWAFSGLYVGMGGFLYLVFRTLAQQLGVNSILISKKGIIAIVATAMGVSILVPHTPTPLPEPVYDASIISVGLLIVFSTISVVLGRAVVRKVSALYKKAIWCLISAAGVMATGGALILIVRLIWLSTGQAPLFMSMSAMLLSLIGAFLFLYASYIFNKTSRY